jgi:hypothetical protein
LIFVDHPRKCIYAFTDPFYPSFTLPPAQPYSPGDVQLNQNNPIRFTNGSSIAPGQGCNSRDFSYYDSILDQFLNTYIDSTGANTSIADIIYATSQDHLNVRTIQTNQANLGQYTEIRSHSRIINTPNIENICN